MLHLIVLSILFTLTSSYPQDLVRRVDIPAPNCKGSGLCSNDAQFKSTCQSAIDRFADDKNYAQYSSCTYAPGSGAPWPISEIDNAGCTAFYTCDKIPPLTGMPMLSGGDIKDLFGHLWGNTQDHGAGCGACGSYYFSRSVPLNQGKIDIVCRVTVNYCYNCNDANCDGAGLQA